MARLLEEADIDEWFLEQKTNLADAMMAALEKGANPEIERKKFDTAFWKLFSQYDKMHKDADAYKLRQKKIKAPIEKFTRWRKEKIEALKSWWRLSRERLKKWWFEVKYRRMFHIRQRKI